jgi:hypothetical protein
LAPPPVRVLIAVALVYLASLLPFFIFARLRVQLLPPLAVLAGGGPRMGRGVGPRAPGTTGRDRRRHRRRSSAFAAWLPAAVDGAAAHRLAGDRLAQHRRRLTPTMASARPPATHSRAPRRSTAAAVPASLRMLASYYRDDGDYLARGGDAAPTDRDPPRQPLGAGGARFAVRPHARRSALARRRGAGAAPRRVRERRQRRRERTAGGGRTGRGAGGESGVAVHRRRSGAVHRRALRAAAGHPGVDRVRRPRRPPRAFAQQLGAAFESAGWTVRGIVETSFPLRSGLFVFAADETPSPARPPRLPRWRRRTCRRPSPPVTARTRTNGAAPTPTGADSSSPPIRNFSFAVGRPAS